MALVEFPFAPGIDKQDTTVGAENRWVDSDNVRFRYGLPEKVGGWSSLVSDSIVGVVRKQHSFVDLDGNRYVALGTDKFLLVYFEGQLHDVTPLKATLTSATIATVNTSPTCTITKASHGLAAGDIILLDSVTLPGGTGFSASDFEDKVFQVITVPTSDTFTITQSSNAGGTVSTGGSLSIKPYEPVGPSAQSYGYGFGIGNFGGTVSGVATTTLNGALNADTAGTGGSGTAITLTSVTGFPTGGGTIAVGNELITYTGVSSNDLTGITRGTNGTATIGTSNGQAHSSGATVTNATNFSGFGSAVNASTVVLEPGLWSLDNFGQVLVANIANGKTFTWNSGAATPLLNRASTTTSGFETSNNPTASRVTLISPTTRHLIHFGTETTIGTTTTQDDMFIRFSSQENITDYTPTATNSAGTQRLADGSRIIGAKLGRNAIYIWSDTSLFTMRFVGGDFIFAFEQVGTNCGLIGMNAAVEVDGAAYWMSENGFFRYTGKLESMDCLVEDYVFDDLNTTSNMLIYCGINNLFGEITWFYPTSTSNVVNRAVSYSYLDSTAKRPIWFTNASSLFPRTTWEDSSVFGLPHGTQYDAGVDTSFDVTGNTDGTTIYFEHETGVNQQLAATTATAIPANITSGDYDITQKVIRGAATNLGDLRGDGENIMRVSRIIPDFIAQQGDAIIQLDLRNYPNNAAASSSLGPFTVSSTTTKVDTRARARAIALTISNTAVDTNWKLGTFRLDIQTGGRR